MPTYTVLRSFPVILIWSLIAQQLRNLRDKTMAYKFMYIPSENEENYHFFRFQLRVEAFGYPT